MKPVFQYFVVLAKSLFPDFDFSPNEKNTKGEARGAYAPIDTLLMQNK